MDTWGRVCTTGTQQGVQLGSHMPAAAQQQHLRPHLPGMLAPALRSAPIPFFNGQLWLSSFFKH